MKHARLAATAAAFSTLALGAPPHALGQGQENLTDEQARARARQVARILEENARVLTAYDRDGNVTAIIGEPGIYTQPSLSPDGSRLAVVKSDPDRQTNDIWVLSIATGQELRITSSAPLEPVSSPVWSSDGQELAYMALRDSYYSVFRSAADGQGETERLYRHPGGPLILTDWSLDGRFLVFSAADLVGARLYVLPIEGDGEVHEIARSESQLLGPRLSPDGRLVAYRSNETGRNEIFVRALPPPGNPDAAVEKWQVSTEGGVGMMYWRSDGNELYYLGADRNLMAVPVATDQGFEFGTPQPLFRVPDTIPVVGMPGGLGNISRDGERIVLAVPRPPQLQQITLYDRAGEVVGVVGEPGLYTQLALSHDGRRVIVLKQDLEIGTLDVWAYDIGTGAPTQLTFDAIPEVSPTLSPDGQYISYVSVRETRAGLYRRRSDGSGEEELLFRYTPGAALFLTDYSPDGRFAAVDGGGILLMIPLSGENDSSAREPIEFSRDEFDVAMGRFSPDGRFVAYGSNETGRFEVYVRPFDPSTGEAAGNEIWQISSVGALGGIGWRQDGKELYFLSEDIETGEIRVMAAEISLSPVLQPGTSTELFRVPGPPRGPGRFVSADGERFAFLPPLPRAPAGR